MQSPYLLGPYRPVDREIEAELKVLDGAVPHDLAGTYVRNGPNPRHAPRGLHHWFDGDGMLHAARFEDGRIRYRNRYVATAGFEAETTSGEALWTGLMESTKGNPQGAPYKDTGNTDVLGWNGELLTLWYVSGAAHRVEPETLSTLGRHTLGGEGPRRMSAHAKVDPKTDELLFFDYGPRPPFMRFGVAKEGELVHETAIELPAPRLPHDMAFTENHAVLMDLPVWYRPEALKARKWMVDFHPDQPARFGVLPRRGDGAAIRWFEAEPCYVYHVVNAWEEDGSVVMIGCRCDDPIGTPRPEDGPFAQAMATLRLRAHLYRWRFDLTTGQTHEAPLDDLNAEFPSIAPHVAGQRSRFSYHMCIPTDASTLLFDGIAKYDLEGGRQRHTFGDGVYGSEVGFARREGGHEEDDGYLVSFVHDLADDQTSQLWVYDAKDIERGPVCRAEVPQRVPLGFHATFMEAAR
ncbi:MAG: carotenoid oxygenase family protein [Sandaracinaceae bacterium]